MRAALLLAMTACAAHAHEVDPSAPPPSRVYDAQRLELPGDFEATHDLAACRGAVAFVPYRGGIVAAGWNFWVVPPRTPPVTSIACDEAGDLFYLRDQSVTFVPVSGESTSVSLPSGDWHLASTIDPAIWIWGTLRDGNAAILHWDAQQGLASLYVGPGTIEALAPFQTTGVIAVVDHVITLWRGETPEAIGRLEVAVDGIALGEDGSLYLSGPGGVARKTSLDSPAELVTRSVHGALQLRGDQLYVLWPEGHSVVRLTAQTSDPVPPKMIAETETVTVHEHHWSRIFRRGPANARRTSIDPFISIVSYGEQSTPTFKGDSIVSSLVLAEAPTLEGVQFGVDLGPGLGKHVVLSTGLSIMGGSANVSSVTLGAGADSTTRAGKAVMSSDVSMVGMSLLAGIRRPLGYFSASMGSGIEAGFLNAVAWKDRNDFAFSLGSNSVWLPLWGRIVAEPSCAYGIFGQAGYDVGLGGTPSALQLGLGFEYRFGRICN